MPATIRPASAPNIIRKFLPVLTDKDPAERIAHALESIAVSLAAIDHNLEAWAAIATRKDR